MQCFVVFSFDFWGSNVQFNRYRNQYVRYWCIFCQAVLLEFMTKEQYGLIQIIIQSWNQAFSASRMHDGGWIQVHKRRISPDHLHCLIESVGSFQHAFLKLLCKQPYDQEWLLSLDVLHLGRVNTIIKQTIHEPTFDKIFLHSREHNNTSC